MFVDDYPNLKKAALLIIGDGGGLHRRVSEKVVLIRVGNLLLSHGDGKFLMACEEWLETLSEETFQEYCIGEETEATEIGHNAPGGLSLLLNQIKELA